MDMFWKTVSSTTEIVFCFEVESAAEMLKLLAQFDKNFYYPQIKKLI